MLIENIHFLYEMAFIYHIYQNTGKIVQLYLHSFKIMFLDRMYRNITCLKH